MIFRPDRTLEFPKLTEEQLQKKPLTGTELKALMIIALVFVGFFTKDFHGLDYSIVVMAGVILILMLNVVNWSQLNEKTEWAVTFMVFGGGIALGTAMWATAERRNTWPACSSPWLTAREQYCCLSG